jgi:hypothetical protein
VAEADVDCREATDGAYTRQEREQKDQAEAILRVSSQMEEPPNGRCQLGKRISDTKAWTDRVGAHGQEPVKVFKLRSMM